MKILVSMIVVLYSIALVLNTDFSSETEMAEQRSEELDVKIVQSQKMLANLASLNDMTN